VQSELSEDVHITVEFATSHKIQNYLLD